MYKFYTGHFAHDVIYRISGDEFVVMADGITVEEFDRSIAGLKHEIDENSSIASLGTASGEGADVSALLNIAEINMYDDKEKFYQKNPDFKRRRTDR